MVHGAGRDAPRGNTACVIPFNGRFAAWLQRLQPSHSRAQFERARSELTRPRARFSCRSNRTNRKLPRLPSQATSCARASSSVSSTKSTIRSSRSQIQTGSSSSFRISTCVFRCSKKTNPWAWSKAFAPDWLRRARPELSSPSRTPPSSKVQKLRKTRTDNST